MNTTFLPEMHSDIHIILLFPYGVLKISIRSTDLLWESIRMWKLQYATNSTATRKVPKDMKR